MVQRFRWESQSGYKRLQRFAWLKRPMREPQILPQVSHLWVPLSMLVEGWRSFLRARFSSAAADILISPSLRCVVRAAQLRAISCQVFPISEVDVQSLHISLAGVTVAELRAAYTSLAGGKLAVEDYFGILPSSVRRTRQSHRSRRWRS